MADRLALTRRVSLLAAATAFVAFSFVPAMAQEAAPAATPAAAASTPDPKLRQAADDFWHTARIGRYDAAVTFGKNLLAMGAAPGDVLLAFEDVARSRREDLDAYLLRFQNTKELAEVTGEIQKFVAQGRFERRSNPAFIKAQIERLIVSPVGFENGLANLRNSGEFAVPLMVEYLRSPAQAKYHDAIRRVIRAMGRDALNPLLASTEMSDTQTLAQIVTLLGDSRYPDVVPYLLRLQATSSAVEVKEAAGRALQTIGASAQPADAAYLELGEKFYAGKASVVADARNTNAFVWYWNDQSGLSKKDVPQGVFDELMAMRSTEYALQLAGEAAATPVSDNALALWLASNYRREIQIPKGEVDHSRAENQPAAHYYGVTAGPKYLGMALTRSLADKDAALSYEIIRSFQQIVGKINLDVAGNGSSLVKALQYPDRRVRFEAAMALAAARPTEAYEGSDAVVPLLGEAVSQTGKPTALLVLKSTESVNALSEALKAAGYDVVGATKAADADNAARTKPAIDVVVIDTTMPADAVDNALALSAANLKLRGSAKLLLTQTSQSSYEQLKQSDPLVSTVVAGDSAATVEAVNKARQQGGSLPLDPAVATDYSLRAAGLLKQLGMTGGIYNLTAVKDTLLVGLDDARPEVVTAIGGAMAQLDDADAQRALVRKANDAAVAADVRISLYKSAADHAKKFGRKLEPAEIAALEKAVTDEADLNVRAAAAEARGALDLPAEQAKRIVLGQVQR
jgi:CheY-like chemotaxis protein